MLVRLLLVPDCPNAEPAAAILRQALDEVGLATVPITTRIVYTQAGADRLGFPGSPTIPIDGRDPLPEPALACRLYPHPIGASGVPRSNRSTRRCARRGEPGAEHRHRSRRPGSFPTGRTVVGHGRAPVPSRC